MTRPTTPTGSDLAPAPTAEFYREVQPMHSNMLVRVGIFLEFPILLAILLPIVLTTNAPGRWFPVLIVVPIVLGSAAFLYALRLTAIVTPDELVVKFPPFPGRRVPIAAIRSAESIRYNALASGGWGWRMSAKYHRIFNVTGDQGVLVVFGSEPKHKFLLGSRDADALAEAIELARFAHAESPTPPEQHAP